MEIDGIKVQPVKIDKKQPISENKSANTSSIQPTMPNYEGEYTPQMFGVLPNFKLAKTLSQPPVSFKGTVLKKSDFKGTDLAVIEQYKPNIQQFKSKEDLQTFSENKINELKEKDFGGRQEETKIQRKAKLKEWFDYVIKENDAYSNTQRLIILSAITKDLKPNNDNIPEVLNKGILAQTVTELEEKLKSNPKENFDFLKMYKNNLRTSMMEDSSTGGNMTGWVVIPSKENDTENFEKNVEKLKTLSHKSWCTKSFNAEPYLSQGDFHVYLENGQPKLGVRFVGNEVQEIQGEKNNCKIPQKYLETFKEHQKKCNMQLRYGAQNELDHAEATKVELQKVKKELGSAVELKTIEDAVKVLNYFGIETEKTEKGLIILEYKQPSEDLTFDDYGINENKLFKHIEQIKGTAIFSDSQVTNLGNLQLIGGSANFFNSQITNLGNLQSIGGSANFQYSQITKLGNLQSIGGNADFRKSKVTNLGNLQSIGGDVNFESSQITNLGNLQSIGGNADFICSQVTNLGNLQSIGGDAHFNSSQITDLGNLQSIGRAAYFNYSQVTDLGNLQLIGNDADFRESKVTNLGNLQSIGGDVVFAQSNVTDLGNLKSIDGSIRIGNEELRQKLVKSLEMMNGLNLSDIRKTIKEGNTEKILNAVGIKTQKDNDGLLIISEYKQPPSILKFADLGLDENELFKDIKEIQGNAYFKNSQVTNLGNLQSIGGNADFRDSQVTNLGNLQSIGGNADFIYSQVTNLGNLQSIGGGADFRDSQITDLGDLQSIGGNAYFHRSKLINLAKLQSIGGCAVFRDSQITDLGDLQSIGGDVDFEQSNVTDLGDLQSIGGNAYFTSSQITGLGNLKSIGGDIHIGDEELKQKLIDSLELINGTNLLELKKGVKEGNIEKILNAVGIKTQKDKDGLLIISEYKQPSNILNFTDLGLDENVFFENIKEIKGKANFKDSQITDLGNLQSIGGIANFFGSQITDLGNLQSIGGIANFTNSKVTNLGNLQSIGGKICGANEQLKEKLNARLKH